MYTSLSNMRFKVYEIVQCTSVRFRKASLLLFLNSTVRSAQCVLSITIFVVYFLFCQQVMFDQPTLCIRMVDLHLIDVLIQVVGYCLVMNLAVSIPVICVLQLKFFYICHTICQVIVTQFRYHLLQHVFDLKTILIDIQLFNMRREA